MADHVVEVRGARLAAGVQEGDGPTVVALHGMLSSRTREDAGGYFGWASIAAEGRRLVRYDARGHGASTGRPEPDDWRWPNLADDLLALLDAVAPGQQVDAIGVSMGVGTILTAAAREPERFRRLALVIPPTAWATRTAQGAMYAQSARFIEQRGLDAFVRGAANLPLLPILEAGGWPTVVAPDVPERLLPAVFRGCGASDLPDPEALAVLKQPVLLAPWTDDPGHPLSTADRLTDVLPNATVEVVRSPADLRGLGDRVAHFLA